MGSAARTARTRAAALPLTLLLLLLLASPAAAFTRTSTRVSTETRTVTRTSSGSVVTVTTTSKHTSYIIFMNDNGPVSSFIGVPATTTDEDGNQSTYLSPVAIRTSRPVISTRTPSATKSTDGPTPSPTSPPESPSASLPASASTSASEGPAEGRSTSIGPIIGGVVGGVLALVILGVLGWLYKRKADRKKQLEEHHREEMQLLAMQLDGSFRPDKLHSGGGGGGGLFSGSSGFGDTHANGSMTDDLVSRYTGGTLSRSPPTLLETFSSAAPPISIGAELTMDSQGRAGMPDGSPVVLDLIMPLRNSKMSDFYADLEWFPLVISESELMQHQGPSYIEDKALHNVANYIQRPPGQKGAASAGRATRRP